MATYAYEGPVMQYDKCVAHVWKAETTAPSEAKARSNFIFRYKKENGLVVRTNVSLPGKIRQIE